MSYRRQSNVTKDGEILKILLKVKDDAPVGNYTLDIQPVAENVIDYDSNEVVITDIDCVVMVRVAE